MGFCVVAGYGGYGPKWGQQGSGVAGRGWTWVGRGRRGLAAGRKASGSRIAQMASWGVGSLWRLWKGGPRKGPRTAAGTRRFSGGNGRGGGMRDVDC
jgi:hypothetical protein